MGESGAGGRRMHGLWRQAGGGLTVAMLAAGLASCGFSPMYAEQDGMSASASWEQVDVAPSQGRLAQFVYRELVASRPPSTEGGRPYMLRFSVKKKQDSLLGDRVQRVRLTVNFSLVQRASGRVFLQGKTFGEATYRTTRMHYANLHAEEAAQRTAAKLAAEDVRTRVVAFLARGMPSSVALGVQPRPSSSSR